jgi:hypothetical protein
MEALARRALDNLQVESTFFLEKLLHNFEGI